MINGSVNEEVSPERQAQADEIYDKALEHARRLLPDGYTVRDPDDLDRKGGFYKVDCVGIPNPLVIGVTVHAALLGQGEQYYVDNVTSMFDKERTDPPASEFRPLTKAEQEQQWHEDGEDFEWTLPEHPWLIFRLPVLKHLPRLPFIRSLRAHRLQRMRFDHEGPYADRVTEEEFTYDLWVIHGIEKGRA